jgi:hypothetical protein
MSEEREVRMVKKRFFLIGILATGLVIARAATSADEMPPIPQEAFDACAGKKQADPCSVTFQGHDFDGTCNPAPQSDKLFCRPNDFPPPPR